MNIRESFLYIIDEISNLGELANKVKEDPNLMILLAIAVSIGLAITLIIVVFTININNLKRVLSLEVNENKKKIQQISKLTREIKFCSKENKINSKELEKYEELKKILEEKDLEIKKLKTNIKELKKESSHHENNFIEISERYNKSLVEIKGLKKRNEELIDERRGKNK